MKIRSEAIRLTVFALVGALFAGLLYLTLGEITLGSTRNYRAVMSDVSGLQNGDLVKVAGVRVGQVKGLEVLSDNRVAVEFDLDEDHTLTDRTQVLVRYENLLGDRYLELDQPAGEGKRLKDGATIPEDRTTPALDLDVLLNGFRPLFQGLAPEQVNQLASSLINTLQGRGGTIESLLGQTAQLTNGLADHDKAIGSLIGNLDTVLASIDSRDVQLRTTISQMRRLVSGLSADRDPLAAAVSSINGFSASFAGLLADVRAPLDAVLGAVRDVAALLNRNTERLDKTLKTLPGAYRRLSRIGSHGSFFNFYLCSVQVAVGGPQGPEIKSPVIRSNVDRCK
jgi:phospholipid/cholesterol/gamma-HCH transport system substrate-binding protein